MSVTEQKSIEPTKSTPTEAPPKNTGRDKGGQEANRRGEMGPGDVAGK